MKRKAIAVWNKWEENGQKGDREEGNKEEKE